MLLILEEPGRLNNLPGRSGAASGSCHLPGELQTATVSPPPILEEGAPGLPAFPARLGKLNARVGCRAKGGRQRKAALMLVPAGLPAVPACLEGSRYRSDRLTLPAKHR